MLELLFNTCYSTVRKVVHDMKKESTATRLKQIMQERQLRQVDILEKCKPFCKKFNIKLGRNDLSQYVNGKVEPGQDKLTILGMALNVSEAWLMGFDVQMEREPIEKRWNRGSRQFESHINAFYYQMQSLGWTYEWLDDEKLYRFSNGTAFFKISSEKYSDFIESMAYDSANCNWRNFMMNIMNKPKFCFLRKIVPTMSTPPTPLKEHPKKTSSLTKIL